MQFESCDFSDSNNVYHTQIVGKSIIKSQDNEILPQDNKHEFNILTDCQKCYSQFQDPVTLSCGFTLCYDCIPKKPQFKCISFTCLRTHEHKDCMKRINITLKDILSTSSVTQIQQFLHCSVCLQPYHEPITTECGHTFCKECLIRIMTDLDTRSCPICRFELDRIGKPCQTLSHWIQFINHQKSTDSIITDYIPIIKLNTVVTFPTQHCLFHINQHNNQSLFKQMTQNPYQHHYALVLFYNSDQHYYDYGIMVKINHVEYSSDLQHSVIQAYGLFRLHIHQLLQDGDHTYISYVTRLEDDGLHRSSSPTSQQQQQPQHKQLVQQPKPMSMKRPCSMMQSQSLPTTNTNTMHQYHYRKAWTSSMQFSTPKVTVVDECKLKQELNQRVQPYFSKKPELLLKYECYSEQDIEYVWWLCSILPFHQKDKIHLFSLLSLRERIVTLIQYMDSTKYASLFVKILE